MCSFCREKVSVATENDTKPKACRKKGKIKIATRAGSGEWKLYLPVYERIFNSVELPHTRAAEVEVTDRRTKRGIITNSGPVVLTMATSEYDASLRHLRPLRRRKLVPTHRSISPLTSRLLEGSASLLPLDLNLPDFANKELTLGN